jgi:hypothetical protein
MDELAAAASHGADLGHPYERVAVPRALIG